MGAAQDRQDVHEMRVELSIRQWDRVVTAFLAAAASPHLRYSGWRYALRKYDLVRDDLQVEAVPEAPIQFVPLLEAPRYLIRVPAASVWPAAKEGRWVDVAWVFIKSMKENPREQPP